MAISVNASSTSGLQERESSWSWYHTCDASDDLLVVVVCLHDASQTDRNVTAVTFWGQPLAKAAEYDNADDFNIEIWYKTNPYTSGQDEIEVIFGDTVDDFAGYAISLSGADTDTPKGNSNTNNSIYSDPVVSVSTTAGSLVVGGLMITETNANSLTCDDTQIGKDDLGGDTAAGSYEIASGSTTVLSWTYTEQDQNWYMLAQEFYAEGGAPPPSEASNLMLMGVG
jgi:hypothetical protein